MNLVFDLTFKLSIFLLLYLFMPSAASNNVKLFLLVLNNILYLAQVLKKKTLLY